jgi:hypothetical protein
MTIELKTLGIDVSKSSVTVHLLSSYPKGGLKSYWEKTRNKASSFYPAFYSNPDAKKKQKSAFDFADYVNEILPHVAILEPTGNHYSRMKGIDTRKSGDKNSLGGTYRIAALSWR